MSSSIPAEHTDPPVPEVEPVPAGVAALFGPRFPAAAAYARLLATEAVRRGLLGPREGQRVWSRHIAQGAVLAPLIEADARVLDAGTGAGLPGIPLALARPDLSVFLLDAGARRVEFLADVLETLSSAGLPSMVELIRGRLEDLRPDPVDVVVSRALAPLPRLAALCRPWLRPRGRLLAIVGRDVSTEAIPGVRRHICGRGVLAAPVTVLEVPAARCP